MTILRTPDNRFYGLPDYRFEPKYAKIHDSRLGPLRLHYVDEGPADALPVILMHGEPSWSYLYRRMIPPLIAAGLRAIAPDLIGFGRSDKPSERSDYTYQSHVDWMTEWFLGLNLPPATLFCQDWGGLIGLRLVAAHPERFARVMASNTFLPTGDGRPSEAFLRWRTFSQTVPEFPAGGILRGGTARPLGPGVEAAYDAPFPDETYKAGARAFPMLVPTDPNDPASVPNRLAWQALEAFDKPFLTAFSDKDPVTQGLDRTFQERIPGARGQAHCTISNAGHFSQEDAGEDLAGLLIAFIQSNPIPKT
jgi:haloalkane dehalogenase